MRFHRDLCRAGFLILALGVAFGSMGCGTMRGSSGISEAALAPGGYGSSAPPGYDSSDELVSADTTPSGGVEPRYAARSAATESEAVLDASSPSGALLVYTAHLVLAVYEVNATQEKLLALTREAGGHLASREDHALVVRVPAARFEEVFASMQKVGDVQSRSVHVEGVGERFRDLEIRIQNAKSIRARLEELLARAQTVSDALAIERELERITLDLERMKGQLRHLGDRIAFSTISVQFRARGNETVDDAVRLPFDWLERLGLANLLRLR